MLISYTVECAFLFVTWTTLPLSVTATRCVPSGDHATSHTLRAGQKQKMNKCARTALLHSTMCTFACVAILVMQSVLSQLTVATKVPSGEIEHPYTCKHEQHQISNTSRTGNKTHPICVRLNSRLLDQLMRHCVHHSSLSLSTRLQAYNHSSHPLTHERHSIVRLRRFERTAESEQTQSRPAAKSATW